MEWEIFTVRSYDHNMEVIYLFCLVFVDCMTMKVFIETLCPWHR